MKITDLTLYKVPPRWLFLKISTDEGIDGWGEPVIEGRADTVRTAVEEFRNYLIGKDPANIEDHWQVMYRCGFYRGGPEVMSAIAGIDGWQSIQTVCSDSRLYFARDGCAKSFCFGYPAMRGLRHDYKQCGYLRSAAFDCVGRTQTIS